MPNKDDLGRVVAQLAELAERRDEIIREMLAAGERPTDIARWAGLSRERIYQIRNRSR